MSDSWCMAEVEGAVNCGLNEVSVFWQLAMHDPIDRLDE